MTAEPEHFPYIDKNKAVAAFRAFVLPGILNAMRKGHVNRPHLHVVALRPGVPYSESSELPLLFEYSIGAKSDWQWPYDDYAHGKARVTWRTGLPSREVLLTKPHLLRPGDPRYYGSAILDGIITACSGVQPHFDEMFAMMTAAAIRAEASHYAALVDAMGDAAPDFIPLPQLIIGTGHSSNALRLGEAAPLPDEDNSTFDGGSKLA